VKKNNLKKKMKLKRKLIKPQNYQNKRSKLRESKANSNRNHLLKLLLRKTLRPKFKPQLPRLQHRNLKRSPLSLSLKLQSHRHNLLLQQPSLKKNLKKLTMPNKNNLSNLYQST
jgi:hypothetical protein